MANTELKTTCFERAVFYSWYCSIKDCKYCYMSAHKTDKGKNARRSFESLFAETLLIKELGWEFGFLSGGINVFSDEEMIFLLDGINKILKQKIWLNIGALKKTQFQRFKDYITGVVGSVETIEPKLHNFVCPSKPLEPIEKMFKTSTEFNLKNAMTFIVGLGEKKEHFDILKEFIIRNNIVKIHVYGLNPQKGTYFENTKPPSADYQAWWISQIRKEFPDINIQLGIWIDRVNRVGKLLKSGANSISKYPAIRKFGSAESFEIEKQAELAGRKFIGTLTKIPETDWNEKVDKLDFDNEMKEKIKTKLNLYLRQMKK